MLADSCYRWKNLGNTLLSEGSQTQSPTTPPQKKGKERKRKEKKSKERTDPLESPQIS